MDKERFLNNIGKRLKELRGSKSQESVSRALSEILGEERTKEAYQHYEAGRRLVPSDVLWGLSRLYGVSADWILCGKQSVTAKKKPEILTGLYKETITIAELVQSLSEEQRVAVKVILKSMGARCKA